MEGSEIFIMAQTSLADVKFLHIVFNVGFVRVRNLSDVLRTCAATTCVFLSFFAHARTQISQCKNFPGAVPYKQFFWQYFFQGLADRLRIEVYPC